MLAIGVGDTVSFRNDDPYFHNVFSLSPGQGFDAGLYSGGQAYTKTFTRPGPVELLCNIHASMLAYIYVVDSAYYAQPRPSGAFTIRNVPPGRYELHAWHESAATTIKQSVTVGPGGAGGIVVRIPAIAHRRSTFPTNTASPDRPSSVISDAEGTTDEIDADAAADARGVVVATPGLVDLRRDAEPAPARGRRGGAQGA